MAKDRVAEIKRKTAETDIVLRLNVDGKGQSAIATGVLPYAQLDVPDPIAKVADHAGMGLRVGGVAVMPFFIKLGAIAGLSSVILVMLLGQSRAEIAITRRRDLR